MGQLTPEIYNNLCIKYGNVQMDSFMMSLKENINTKLLYIMQHIKIVQIELKRLEQQIKLFYKTLMKNMQKISIMLQ